MDNAPVHDHNIVVENEDIGVIFFPPNTTSLLQPMDQSVIASFKKNYRKFFMRELLLRDDCKSLLDFQREYTIKNAIDNVAYAWDRIPISTLKNAWHKLGLNLLLNEADITILSSSIEIDYNRISSLEHR